MYTKEFKKIINYNNKQYTSDNVKYKNNHCECKNVL